MTLDTLLLLAVVLLAVEDGGGEDLFAGCCGKIPFVIEGL
jgi:hypothetical protein